MSGDMRDHGKRNDRIYRECVGIVETEGKDDPKKLLLVQVRVYGIFDNTPVKDLPWAEYKLPIGARPNDGSFVPVKKGDLVWVDFPYMGDSRRPRITGSVHYAPENVPSLPHETFAGPDAYVHARTGDEPAQPAHVYGEDAVTTLHGVMIAVNKDGSYNVVQKATGTEFTITKDGDMIFHVEGDVYRSASGLEDVRITGAQTTTAMEGIDHDGGTGDPKGNVNGYCLCCWSGQPHPMVSSNVKSTL